MILYTGLAVASVVPLAARSAPVALGAIVQAVRGNGGADIAGTDSAIYAGDRLNAEGDQIVWARLGKLLLCIEPGTVVEVGGVPNDPSSNLVNGAVNTSARENQTFQLLAGGITIQPLGARGSVARVTLVNAHKLEVTSERGGIELSMGEKIQTITQGETYRIVIEPENPEPRAPAAPGKGALPAGNNNFMKYLIGGGAIATGIGIWRAFVSPCAP
jgi:hypothetical protein